MSEVKVINEGDFDSITVHGKWVIDFWAEWCIPCKIMAPHFESVAKEMYKEVHFGKVNVEENYSLAEKMDIRSIPTTVFLKNGEVVHMSVGALNKEQILAEINKAF